MDSQYFHARYEGSKVVVYMLGKGIFCRFRDVMRAMHYFTKDLTKYQRLLNMSECIRVPARYTGLGGGPAGLYVTVKGIRQFAAAKKIPSPEKFIQWLELECYERSVKHV